MFGEDSELNRLREEWKTMSYEDKVDTFLWKMVWYHHQKYIPGNPNAAIEKLSKVIEHSTKSSEALTSSIRKATWVGGIAAAAGVVVAVIALFVKA